jgi:hypothetical protein
MAHKLMLKMPLKGMPFLWNVDKTVGSPSDSDNHLQDVALVQLLLTLCVPHFQNLVRGCMVTPSVSGAFNIETGFHIFYFQNSTQADGFLSPINKNFPDRFALYRINLVAHKHNKTSWENLPNLPNCPGHLRDALNTVL